MGKKYGVGKNGKAKPIKALTGMEIALLSAAAGAAGTQMMSPKPRAATYNDPFKNIPASNPADFVKDSTSSSTIMSNATDPVTSPGESMAQQTVQESVNPDEDTQKMRKGGKVRGVRIAKKGFKQIRVV